MPDDTANSTPHNADDNAPPMIRRPCPRCGATEHTPHLSATDTTFGFPGTFHVVCCRLCGMLHTNPQVAPEALGRYFPADYSAHDADRAKRHADSPRKGHDPWDNLDPFGGKNLLDVGCGSGAFLLRQRQRGWNVFGIEPSPNAANVARSLGLENVWTTDVAGAPFDDRKFDVITLMGVLDHIPEPFPALEKLRAATAPGGRLIVTVPNAMSAAATKLGPSWPGWDLPRHQNHFDPVSLEEILDNVGYDRVEIRAKRRTSHWRRGAAIHAKATGSPFWKLIAASRNLAGLIARLHQDDELIAIAHA